jgi:hypothetical protein
LSLHSRLAPGRWLVMVKLILRRSSLLLARPAELLDKMPSQWAEQKQCLRLTQRPLQMLLPMGKTL